MITRAMLEEEAKAIYEFIYIEHFEDWYDYCKTRRAKRTDGLGENQSLEATSLLVNSLTNGGYPSRFIVYREELDRLARFGENLIVASETLPKNAVENKELFKQQIEAMKGLGEGLIAMIERYKEREPSGE